MTKYFSVSTAIEVNGRKLKAMTPDKDGFYNGMPLATLGTVSRNNTEYCSESLTQQITDPTSSFNIRLVSGDLTGENGHPSIIGMDKEAALRRIMSLDVDKKAVYYKKIGTKNLSDLGLDIIYGDLKPAGPYGKYAEEMLADPNMNFSTSLRAITSMENKPNGVSYRKVIKLITFDANVPAGGFAEASKRYANIGQEEICELIDPLMFLEDKNVDISFESLLTKTEMNDIFKNSKIKIKGRIEGIYLGEGLIYDETSGKKRGMMSTFLA